MVFEVKILNGFLKNQTQRAAVEGAISSAAQGTYGMPQGSVLNSMLFLVYIIDLPLVVSSTIGLFSDNAYMYWVIKLKADTIALQRDLDALVKCKQTWSMKFHSNKCRVLTIRNKRKLDLIIKSITNVWRNLTMPNT